MAYLVTHLSKTDFKIDNYYIYKDANGKWISNPPIDCSKIGLQQAVAEAIQNIENV